MPHAVGLVRTAAVALTTLLWMGVLPGATVARTITVGPNGEVARPSEAAVIARAGDTITIAAGVYEGDVAVWHVDDLTIRGEGGRADIRAAGRTAESKGVWVIKGDNTTIESISLSGARVPDFNGAGIRLEGCNLLLRDVVLRNNQMGILTGHRKACALVIENSEIHDNAQRDLSSPRIGHNIYVGRLGRFVLRGSYVHDSLRGHQVKSRAHRTLIEYNRITDGEESAGSYLIDIPEGGEALIIGNLLQQNARNENNTLISFGAEAQRPDSKLKVLYNTMINDDRRGIFLHNGTGTEAMLANNVISGPGEPLSGRGKAVNNQVIDKPLDPDSDLAAQQWRSVASPPPGGEIPIGEYTYPLGIRDRPTAHSVGAYEGRANH